MTTIQRLMEDAVNCRGFPWRKDTLRVWFSDDRQYWGISEPGDDYRGNCLMYWHQMGGERFDGKDWKPMQPGERP